MGIFCPRALFPSWASGARAKIAGCMKGVYNGSGLDDRYRFFIDFCRHDAGCIFGIFLSERDIGESKYAFFGIRRRHHDCSFHLVAAAFPPLRALPIGERGALFPLSWDFSREGSFSSCWTKSFRIFTAGPTRKRGRVLPSTRPQRCFSRSPYTISRRGWRWDLPSARPPSPARMQPF